MDRLNLHRFWRWLWGRAGAGWDFVFFPLTLLAWIYGGVVRARAGLYRAGLRKPRRVDCRVVSVGNLAVGGVGKTPFVLFLAEQYRARGIAVGVVSRGYGREGSARVAVSDGVRLLATPETAGDEPYLIAARLAEVPVVVSVDRQDGCRWLVEQYGVTVVLLDDAFQHLALHRDLNLLLLDGDAPFGNGRLLPRGLLREPPSALSRADAIFLAGATAGVEMQIPNATCPVFSFAFEPTALVHVATGAISPPSDLAGRDVFALSGIARPDRFIASLERLNMRVTARRIFPDHHRYTAADFAQLQQEAGDLPIVTTEKDAVKLARHGLVDDLDCRAVRIAVQIHSSDWETRLFGAQPPKGQPA